MPTSEPLSSGVLELVLNAGPVAKVVLAILLLFSIVAWALIVEKWWQFRRVRRQTLAFMKVFREGRRPSIVHAAARKFRESPLAQLYAAAYGEISGVPDVIDSVVEDGDEGLSSDRLDAVHRAMRRTGSSRSDDSPSSGSSAPCGASCRPSTASARRARPAWP